MEVNMRHFFERILVKVIGKLLDGHAPMF